jgi:hypothetical protein
MANILGFEPPVYVNPVVGLQMTVNIRAARIVFSGCSDDLRGGQATTGLYARAWLLARRRNCRRGPERDHVQHSSAMGLGGGSPRSRTWLQASSSRPCVFGRMTLAPSQGQRSFIEPPVESPSTDHRGPTIPRLSQPSARQPPSTRPHAPSAITPQREDCHGGKGVCDARTRAEFY